PVINTEILKTEGAYEPEEGCLSVPGYWARVKRGQSVVVRARDRSWKEVRIKGEGLFAQALQHEIDHLDGKLYIDRLESLDSLQRVEPRRPHEPDEETPHASRANTEDPQAARATAKSPRA